MGGVWLITGAQASGKSTVAELLASRFDRAVHVRGGQFYRWVVRGWVHVGADDVVRWLDALVARPRYLVVLRPSVDVVEARDTARQESIGKVAYRDRFTPAINDQHVATTPRDLGLWLDTSMMTAQETVDACLARVDEARIA